MDARVGECASGMIRMCAGHARRGAVADRVEGVRRGPFAVVRYASLPMEVIRCVARLGFERQKKHEAGPAGGSVLRPRLCGREVVWWGGAKREKASACDGAGAERFLLNVKGEAVVPGGIVTGGLSEGVSEKA